jgi:hypothetical protein
MKKIASQQSLGRGCVYLHTCYVRDKLRLSRTLNIA